MLGSWSSSDSADEDPLMCHSGKTNGAPGILSQGTPPSSANACAVPSALCVGCPLQLQPCLISLRLSAAHRAGPGPRSPKSLERGSHSRALVSHLILLGLAKFNILFSFPCMVRMCEYACRRMFCLYGHSVHMYVEATRLPQSRCALHKVSRLFHLA